MTLRQRFAAELGELHFGERAQRLGERQIPLQVRRAAVGQHAINLPPQIRPLRKEQKVA